jgi:hypothetical protein
MARSARRHGVTHPAACLVSSPPPRHRNAREAGGPGDLRSPGGAVPTVLGQHSV